MSRRDPVINVNRLRAMRIRDAVLPLFDPRKKVLRIPC